MTIVLADALINVSNLYLLVNAFILLFSILDAIGSVPIFLALTSNMVEARRRVATHSVIIALIVLLIFASIGLTIFQFLGTTLNDFKIAGGVILFIVAVQHLTGRPSVSAKDVEEIAAFPIATPLLAGPGAISTVIILSTPPYSYPLAIVVILLNSLVAWAILVRSEMIYRVLGSSGTKVMTRIMGLLIAAIAVSFIRSGIEAVILEMGKH